MQYRKDRYGEPISLLGYGCMRFTKNGNSIDLDKAERELMLAIKSGVNYLDTAYIYPGSEVAVGEILHRNHCREEIRLATKLPQYYIKSGAAIEKYFNEQLTRLQTDYIDYYLMHMLTDVAAWEKLKKLGIEAWITQKKKEGKIRNIGFSFHGNTEMFIQILDAYDWDFCQIQYNYINLNYQAGTEGLKYAAGKGMGVVIMEPLLGGKLANLAEHVAEVVPDKKSQVEYALDFLWDKPEVSLLLSGMSAPEQVEQNLEYASRSEIGMVTEEDRQVYAKAKEIFDKMALVNCTKCAYCMPCPFGLNIPELFAAYNMTASDGMAKAKEAYGALETKADSCRACHHCEKECPQHIKISEMMPKVAAAFA